MPKPAAAAPPTSASSWSSEMGQCGSGTSPASCSRPPPRSSTSITPASTSTTWPPSPPACRDLNFTGSLARERDNQLAYFDTNAHRMRYAHFRDLGMFIGSGVVEAGCKAVIGQRLKLSGMRWNIPGATAIATLRCQQASNRWEEIWQRPHNQTPRTTPATCQRQHTQTAAG